LTRKNQANHKRQAGTFKRASKGRSMTKTSAGVIHGVFLKLNIFRPKTLMVPTNSNNF
jgi:hypothetical protein